MDEAGAVVRHRCLIYDGQPSEQLPVIVPLLIDGLREGRRCLYLGSPEAVLMVREALLEKGVAVEGEVARGALVFSSDRAHLKDGFDPRAMIAMLRQAVAQAVSDGFVGLWATGDMRWELGGDENFAKLQEYEALLERVFPELPLAGVCQYQRGMVPAEALQDALLTHRSAYLGSELQPDNYYYVPPDLLLGQAGPDRGRLAEWMWGQVTRIVRAERERERTLSELERLNRDLDRRVKERTSDLEAFSHSLSHDLRAPLRAISGFADLVLKAPSTRLDEQGRDAFARIQAAAARMGRLIDALSEFHRLTQREPRWEDVDLSALAGGILAELRAGGPERRVDARVQGGLRVRGDSRLLGAVLANLLGNAWKFTSRKERALIEFGGSRQNGSWVLFVKDDGEGYDPRQQGRLFKAFERLHSASQFPGSGLGLAIVERIVSRHGGRAWAESDPGRGATFSFSLPAEEPA